MANLHPTRGLSFGARITIEAPILTNVTLSDLSLSANQFIVGSNQGTLIGIVQGLTPGSTLILTDSHSNAVELDGRTIHVGPTPPVVSGSFTFQLSEILEGALNTPHVTTLAIIAVSLPVPINISLPIIFGTAKVGVTINTTNGTWSNTPTSFTYQWNSEGVPIAGANASSYVPVSSDVGNTLTVSVGGVNNFGSGPTVTSLPSFAVIDIIPTINTPASIPSTPMVGSPITAVDAIWNNSVISLAYQWKVAGVNGTGTGANTLTYTPVSGDVGLTLTITVTATNSGGTSLPSTSAASAAVDAVSTDVLAIDLNIRVCALPLAA
jgi:hypothetical protein